MKSPEIQDLATALSKAQAEMPIAGLNKSNPFFKSRYADFQAIVEASRASLTKHGLAVTQQIMQEEEGHAFLCTTLFHASGQWICSKVKIVPAKNDVQSMSSYITYLKRIAYSSLIGVVTGDDDDDGEAAVSPTRMAAAQRSECVSVDQLEQLNYELQDQTDICKMVLTGLNIGTLAEMPKTRFMSSLQRIQALKREKSGN